MWLNYLLPVISILFWVIGIICIKGCNVILVSGANLMPKEDRKKYKEKHDIIAMNRYIGKVIILPLAALCSFMSVTMITEFAWMESNWFAGITIAAVIGIIALCFYGAVQILGSRFEMKFKVE